ncbi:hypothetical protein HWQ46_26925 [Shewanella sp. D64]|uniref:hypothetical protein n=1 Tax=unclassified Shewanella TaxID=196818 RepID=UPI0022BA38B8|nr:MULTISPECIES: hypothetical protein [unclassified Shewanella]MEC4729138.1 hypothetical protein [Shewanella sp. D64]MEC4738193.1 hypothetical protein [Shewanella sp. E94]WBJ95337.1 hypothetical protein HWQ47_26710 [Shewanella sp. MTB7]
MPVFKAICPVCDGNKTTIRTSKRIAVGYQVLYCDCLDENCLTRFKVDSTIAGVIHTMRGNHAAGFALDDGQLSFNL